MQTDRAALRSSSFSTDHASSGLHSQLQRRSVGQDSTSCATERSILASVKQPSNDSQLGMRLSCGYSNSRTSASALEGFIDIGCASMEGTRYGGLQQDFMAIQQMYAQGEIPKDGKQVYIAVVTDGHGIVGDKCAQYAGKALTRQIYSGGLRNKNLAKMSTSDISKEMRTAFAKGHNAALSVYSSPPAKITYLKTSGKKSLVEYALASVKEEQVYRSAAGTIHHIEGGCTATAAIVQGTHLSLANVGDSFAVLGICDGPGLYRGQVLTVRHNGNTQEEKERMAAFLPKTKLLEDGYLQISEGKWMGYELAVTRALGHKEMEQFGVISEPSVMHMSLNPDKHRCLIIASDGVWDSVNPDDAVQHVMRSALSKGAADCAKALVEHAVETGLAGEVEEADNTTAVVLLLE